MSRPNYRDIARLAGVGTATVERVLNGRGGVRAELVEKVVIAARELDYPRTLPETHRGLLRIEVLMVRPETTFYRRLSKAFERIAATLDPLVVVHRSFAEEMKPEELASRIIAAGEARAGLILAVPSSPAVSAAVEAVVARGIPVVHVVTRASAEKGEFIGIDNGAAGRTAAHFITRMAHRDGPVIALCHPIYQVHRDRISGFSDYFRDHPGKHRFEWLGFTRDDEYYSAEALRMALDLYPDMAGLYNYTNRADVLRLHEAISGTGLRIEGVCFPRNVDDLRHTLELAQEFPVSHIDLQADIRPRRVEDCLPLLDGWMRLAEEAGVPVFIETHRNRITSDLPFTLDLLEQRPDLPLLADLSHYLVAREFAFPVEDESQREIQRILHNTQAFHGRIGSCEQIQIEISFAHHRPWVDLFLDWWDYGFRHWRSRAPDNAELVFTCELGPRPYAITDRGGNDSTDRWAESLLLKTMAQTLWAQAAGPANTAKTGAHKPC